MKTILILICISPFCLFGQDTTHLSSDDDLKKGLQEYNSANYKLALEYFLKAANLGNPVAQNKLGNLYLNGDHVKQDYVTALSWYKKSAAAGNVDAINNIGWMFENGKGVQQDFSEASNWFRRSVEMGSAYGQNHLGGFYKNGTGVAQNYGKALELFQKSAEQGNATGQFYMGVMFDFGYGVTENDAQAVKLYQKAALQGMGDAQYNLGLLYEDGNGIVRDYSEAAKWYLRAADQGQIKAKYRLGLLFQGGNGVDKNLPTALQLYKEAAEKGYSKAQSQLGYLLVFGDSVNRNYSEGVKWLKEAADQNAFGAQFRLGQCYSQGRGVKQDKKEAFKLIEKSANQSYASAQVELGVMYYEGVGTEKNIVEAAKLFEKAANQGSKTAQRNLRIIYERKEIKEKTGVPGLDSLLFLPLKYQLSASDKSAIREKARSSFQISSSFSINISIGDLLPNSKRKADEPASIRRAEELLKKLAINQNDFNACLSLGDVYLKLHKRDEGYKYLDRAESIAKEKVVTNPSDYSQILNLVYVYMAGESYSKALDELGVYSKKKPNDPEIEDLEFLCYLGAGDLKKFGDFGNLKIQKDPHDANGYLAISFLELGKLWGGEKADIMNKSIEEMADLTPLSNATNKYPNDYKLKFLQKALRHMILLFRVLVGMSDPNAPSFNGFKLTEYDKAEIKKLESFYLSSLSNKGISSKFLPNKLLAGLYTLTGEYDKALSFARFAIEIKTKEVSFYKSNTDELYDLMTTVQLLKKDTLMAEKILIEKISQAKESYQSANDYCSLARFKLWKGDLSETEKACKLALDIDPMTQEALIGLATASIVKGDPRIAKDYLLKAMACGKDSEEIKTLNGIIWMDVDDYESAFQSFNEAVELNKDDPTPKSILNQYFRN